MTVEPHARTALQTIVKHMTVDGGPVAAAVATLAAIVEQLLPPEVPPVQCPACKRMVVPLDDGTLPGHDIAPGPRRSPRCRFRGRVDAAPCVDTSCDASTDRSTDSSDVMAAVERAASADLLAAELAHEVGDAAELILDRALPGRGSD